MKKLFYIKPMTCKEFAQKYHPELIMSDAGAGVLSCPFGIGLTVKQFYECQIYSADEVPIKCIDCWNQPAKYHGKYIMKVKVLK